ncbi:MAG: phosphatase PAP2 family protein [Candidatus Micrarchaeota archaeon]
MAITLERYVNKTIQEITRDFTAFGNPFVLGVLTLAVVGVNMNLLYIFAGLVFIEIFCFAIKFFYHKDRPNKEEYANLIERIDASSFPSVHTARASFAFLALFFLTPGLEKFLFLALIPIIGATRVLLKKHFLVDVLGGYAVAILSFVLWLWLAQGVKFL